MKQYGEKVVKIEQNEDNVEEEDVPNYSIREMFAKTLIWSKFKMS